MTANDRMSSVDLARCLEAWLATERGRPTAESFLREQAGL
jgi:hypothetical protein